MVFILVLLIVSVKFQIGVRGNDVSNSDVPCAVNILDEETYDITCQSNDKVKIDCCVLKYVKPEGKVYILGQ